MELKVLCDCGQKLKFDVEPMNGRMPSAIICPTCNEDMTAKANSVLAENLAVVAAPAVIAPLPAPSTSSGLRLHRTEPLAPPMPETASPGYPQLPTSAVAGKPKAANGSNLGLGILGALLGAGLGAGLIYGLFLWAGFRFPLMGTCIGALAGLGARILYKGTDMTLGIIAAAIAVLVTSGTLYFMYGDLAGMFVISIVVSGIFAYRVAN
jgi:hypothetical protein